MAARCSREARRVGQAYQARSIQDLAKCLGLASFSSLSAPLVSQTGGYAFYLLPGAVNNTMRRA